MSKKEKNPEKLGVLKFWGWQMRAVSAGSIVVVMGYLSIFCTNTLMMSPALVGTLLMASKIFDGVTDLIAGYVIDKTHTKLGKARPYEFCVIGVWLCTWLLFNCSEEWSMTVKSIWIFVMYTFVNSVFATFLSTNQTAYMVRAFDTQSKIVKVNSYGGIVVTMGCAVVSMSFPALMAKMATSAGGWSELVGIYALPLAVIGMGRFFFVKETVQVEETADKLNLKSMFKVLKTNKYIYVAFAIGALYNLTLGLNAQTYYFTDVVGNIGKLTMIAALSMPMLIVMFIFPIILKKHSIAQLMAFGGVVGIIGGILNFLAGSNMALLMAGGACIAFAGLPIAYLSGLLILDCAAFNEKCGEPRMEGVMSAFHSFASKIGQGVGAAMLGGILSVSGYNGAAAVQSDSALMGIRILYGIIPAVIFLLVVLAARSYKLDKVLKGEIAA
ncbi:MFS transporter [Faecalicatena sp. AGMB00832]|uniref:MFS transporter n=1 Tax=Faecalicatena faecalis TaxID=2726362 RepID=A0ABS6D158_9FIRM|nr:MFS transporter [Faecalicatena faecalis]MBU3875243.1 MFS transporter [Faecalicatena faecalis]